MWQFLSGVQEINIHQGDLAKHMYPQFKKITRICIFSIIDKSYAREIQIFARTCSVWVNMYILKCKGLNTENWRR